MSNIDRLIELGIMELEDKYISDSINDNDMIKLGLLENGVRFDFISNFDIIKVGDYFCNKWSDYKKILINSDNFMVGLKPNNFFDGTLFYRKKKSLD